MPNPLYRGVEEAKLAIIDRKRPEPKLMGAGQARGFRSVSSFYEEMGDLAMAKILRLDLKRWYRGE